MKFKLILAGLTFSIALSAQENVVTSGGEAAGSGGSASYTLGQVVYITNTEPNASEAQGVQQPFEISTTVGIAVTEIKLEFDTYPNPTANSVTLSIGNYKNEKLTYHLYNLRGELLQTKEVTNSSTSIGMHELSPSIYLLSLIDKNGLVKTFQIIKN